MGVAMIGRKEGAMATCSSAFFLRLSCCFHAPSVCQVEHVYGTHAQYMQFAGWVFGPLPHKLCASASWCFDPVTKKLREMSDADYPPNCRRAALPAAYEKCYPTDANGSLRPLRVQVSPTGRMAQGRGGYRQTSCKSSFPLLVSLLPHPSSQVLLETWSPFLSPLLLPS